MPREQKTRQSKQMTANDEGTGTSFATTGMPFIISSDTSKVDPVTRRLIRSHVMRGKKQKKRRPKEASTASTSRTRPPEIKLEEAITLYTPQIPARVGSDISFLQVTGDIESSILLNIVKVSTFAMCITFPLIMAIGFEADNKEWLHIIGRDAAALHITAFAIEGFIDQVLYRRENRVNLAAMLHFEKGLAFLQQRLLKEGDEESVSDSTIGVVLKLASASHFIGHFEGSRRHLEGIRRMVDLRGGLHVFEGKHLLVEMLRCDLGVSLLNCATPVFYSHPSEPMVEYPAEMLTLDEEMSSPYNDGAVQYLDRGLARAWRVMKRFCSIVNLGTQIQRSMRLQTIYDTMTAVIYRLLRMQFAGGTLDEAIRHGLLAFCYHIFLQWRDINLPCPQFCTEFRNSFLNLGDVPGASSQLKIWLLMTGTNSVFDIADEPRLAELLREHVNKCQVRTWKEMQDIMKSFMWVQLLDEQLLRVLFEKLDF